MQFSSFCIAFIKHFSSNCMYCNLGHLFLINCLLYSYWADNVAEVERSPSHVSITGSVPTLPTDVQGFSGVQCLA